jgi:hypothetical protein
MLSLGIGEGLQPVRHSAWCVMLYFRDLRRRRTNCVPSPSSVDHHTDFIETTRSPPG